MKTIDRILLGQNQFFGVNHVSDLKGNETLAYFSDIENIINYLTEAVELGIDALTISTHPTTPFIMDAIRKNKKLKSSLKIYPSIPSATNILRMTAEMGIPKTLLYYLRNTSVKEKAKILVGGGMGLINKDLLSLLKALIEVELSIFKGLNIRGVFLSNNINDLALGFDLEDVFHEYVSVLEKKDIVPCFNTVNLPFFVNKMKEYNIEPLPVMAATNKLGFFVNPSLSEFENTLNTENVRLVVMSSLASGQLSPAEAYRYIGSLPNVESIAFGASTKEHVLQNISAINKSVTWDKSI
jgi:hypothetical protein